jgi:hypothetical protein
MSHVQRANALTARDGDLRHDVAPREAISLTLWVNLRRAGQARSPAHYVREARNPLGGHGGNSRKRLHDVAPAWPFVFP